MSQLSSGIFGGIAVALTFGAMQLASGRDLYSGLQLSQALAAGPASLVNRAVKSDRAPRALTQTQTRTISVRLDKLSDTSILVRIPAAGEVPAAPVAPVTRPGGGKATVACEAVVSVLTDIAKQLQPGRCVT